MSVEATYRRVCEVVDADIRPGLKMHGGDIAVVAVTADGCVEVAFAGACRGCALQSVTYAVGVRQRLLEVPGVSDVTMQGGRLSPVALARIGRLYRGYRFR